MKEARDLSAEERLNRLRLIRSENVGPITFRHLMARHATAADALRALPALAKRGGRNKRLRIASAAEAQAELDALAALGGVMLHLGTSDYPAALAATEDAPPVLGVLGHQGLLSRDVVAIVGSRNASTNGKRLAHRFARALGEAGFVVASGLARGLDAAGHEGALETGTIAVVAGGVDVIYPRENTRLYHDIVARGAVVAEQPVGAVGQARHFPRRNRIISGLARAVLVVEATLESGSLITARLAGDQGREVMAIPGSPLDPRARGGNDLIRKGAVLIETPDEMIRYLREMPMPELKTPSPADYGGAPEGTTAPRPSEDALASEAARTALVEALSPTPVALDDLVVDLGMAPATVTALVLEMEVAGLVERHPGGRVSLLMSEDPPVTPTASRAPGKRQTELF
jgi:DNA processing protein